MPLSLPGNVLQGIRGLWCDELQGGVRHKAAESHRRAKRHRCTSVMGPYVVDARCRAVPTRRFDSNTNGGAYVDTAGGFEVKDSTFSNNTLTFVGYRNDPSNGALVIRTGASAHTRYARALRPLAPALKRRVLVVQRGQLRAPTAVHKAGLHLPPPNQRVWPSVWVAEISA